MPITFSPAGFALARAITRDMEDQQRAGQISFTASLLGQNLPAIVLFATAARQGERPRGRPGVIVPAGDGAAAPALPAAAAAAWVEVPDPEGDQEVTERIFRARGLVPEFVGIASDDPVGGVMGCDPEAGTAVRAGSRVRVFVSAGLRVPGVVGLDIDDADELITAAGLAPDPQESEKRGTPGKVQRQEPEEGEYAGAKSQVTFYFTPRAPLEPVDDNE